MKSYWIWNWGDWEVFHTNLVNSRREQYGMDYPPFWKMYDVDRNVTFFAEKEIAADGELKMYLNGKGYIKIDGIMYPDRKMIKVKKGKHSFQIHLMNLKGLPSAYIESEVIGTDGEWFTLDSMGERVQVGFDERYTAPESDPEKFPFSYEAVFPVSAENRNGGVLLRKGKEYKLPCGESVEFNL